MWAHLRISLLIALLVLCQQPPARAFEQPGGLRARGLDARWFHMNQALIGGIKGALDTTYRGRDLPRFYVLETVARVPYFAYASVLHLRETLGQRDLVELIRTHYSQADNEQHHLLVMSALATPSKEDEMLAMGLSVLTFWYSVLCYLCAPRVAYHLSELIERHAYETYDEFLANNEADLKTKAVPDVAAEYYSSDFFKASTTRRPQLRSLYDVFEAVRDDELGHWSTLCSLVQFEELPRPTTEQAPTCPS